MSVGARETTVHAEALVVQLARAFRSAARVVGFYPPAHPAVGASLEHVMSAARAATGSGPLVLTILPDVVLAGGVPLESREPAIAELASILHRQGIGALNLRGIASVNAWRGFFELLALPPEDVRASGGIQRRWTALRHADPLVLEIDFGEMLRGRVGGDFGELAGVINHYLEMAAVGSSFPDDPLAVLLDALRKADGDEAAVTALVSELRAGAQLLRMTQADRFDPVMREAARIGEHLTPTVMQGLLSKRGRPEVIVAAVDVVSALAERMSDATVARFLASALASGGADSSSSLVGIFTTLVPDPHRRKNILPAAKDCIAAGNALDPGDVARWSELERLADLSDRQFVSEQYAHELETARQRSEDATRMSQDPPERVAAWVSSLDDDIVNELDLCLLEDLTRIEREPDQLRDVLEILLGRVYEAADRNDWETAARITKALAGVGPSVSDSRLKAVAGQTMQALTESSACAKALASLGGRGSRPPAGEIRFIVAAGPTLIPGLVERWMDTRDEEERGHVGAVLRAFGKDGREALRRLLSGPDPELKKAAIALLADESATDHLPALEPLLLDGRPDVSIEALRALACAPSERAHEILARGIARGTADQQIALIGEFVSMAAPGRVSVLRRLVAYLDQPDIDPQVYLAVIDGLKAAGGPEAAAALGQVLERGSWKSPLRTLRFRSAAKDALNAIGRAGGDR